MNQSRSFLKKFRLKYLIRKAFQCLPESFRFKVYRALVVIEPEIPTNLTFRVARTKEELEAAFKILHDEYVRAGFMNPTESGLRVTPYHALPTTSTLVAMENGEVIATVSIVRDSIFGFPLDKIFETKPLRKEGARLAEISALAIRQDKRNISGAVLFPLLNYLYKYCTRYFGVDYKVIAVNPKHFDFYRGILFFEKLDAEVVGNYSFVNDAPAVGGYLDLRQAYKLFAIHYGNKKLRKNLFTYFTELESINFEFPDRQYFKISDPIMTPELLDYFFNQKSDVFATMPDRERAMLCDLYKSEDYLAVLPKPQLSYIFHNARRETRHDVVCNARIVFSHERVVKMKVLDVSLHGFRALLEERIRFGDVVMINIALGDFQVAEIMARPVWCDNDGIHGFKVESWEESWESFIKLLNAETVKEAISA